MRVHRSPARRVSRQGDRWTTSYADFVTILLVLFVAIAAQGMQSAIQVRVPVAAPAARPVTEPKPPAILTALKPLEEKGVRLKVEARGIVISLEQKVLFDSGNDQISDAALPVVGEIAAVLKGIPNKVNLIGHADSRPMHSTRFRDNWELSIARSLRLRELLSREFGIPEDRLSVASYGATSPAVLEDTEAGRANNRRVEIVILDFEEAVGAGRSK